jgi:hypothetical protein
MKTPIPVTDHAIPYTPPALLGRGISFAVKPLAPIDFELLSLELYRHDLQVRGMERQRVMLIDELFIMRSEQVPGGDEGRAEEAADAEASLIEENWELDAAHGEALQAWAVRDRERMRDISAGAEPIPPEPKPVHRLSVRKRVKIQAVMDELLSRKRVKDWIIEDQTREMNIEYNLCRLTLLGWDGLETEYARKDGIIPDDVMRAMTIEIGRVGFNQLRNFVMNQDTLTLEEVGNLDSPPDTADDQTGSEIRSGGSATSDGYSTSVEPVETSPAST